MRKENYMFRTMLFLIELSYTLYVYDNSKMKKNKESVFGAMALRIVLCTCVHHFNGLIPVESSQWLYSLMLCEYRVVLNKHTQTYSTHTTHTYTKI